MEENQHQNDSGEKVNTSASPTIGEEVTEDANADSGSTNSAYTKIKEWFRRHKEPSPHLIINILMLVVTFLLFMKAANQSDTYIKTLNETIREFRLNHAADVRPYDSTYVSRHWWAIRNRDGIQITMALRNTTPYRVTIDSIKQKWVIDSFEINKGFNNIKDFKPCNPMDNHECSLQHYPYFRINRIPTSISDSVQISKGHSVLFYVVYYTNTVTLEKFEYRCRVRVVPKIEYWGFNPKDWDETILVSQPM